MLKVVYIADYPDNKPEKRKSARQLLHESAIELIAAAKINDRKRAQKLFKVELKELAELRQKLNYLKNKTKID